MAEEAPGRVLRLTDKVEDTRYETPETTLERAMEHVRGTDRKYNRCVVVLCDDSPGTYYTERFFSAGKFSVFVGLLEFAKLLTFKDMQP